MESDGLNRFLLTEFLASLEEVGLRPTLRDHRRLRQALAAEGRWTRSKLRTVLAALLARSREEQALITARFDSFFDVSALATEEIFPPIDVERALAELTSLPPVPPEMPVGQGGPKEVPPPKSPAKRRRRWLAPLIAALLTVAALGLPTLVLERQGPEINVSPVKTKGAKPLPETPPGPVIPEAERQYEGAPEIGDPIPLPPERRSVWSGLLTAALVLLGLGLGYGAYLWRSHRVQEPEPLPYDPHDPSRFDPGVLGGAPAPWLGDECLDLAAESLEYLETEAFGRALDPEATVEITTARAGLPSLVYLFRRELQTAVVLEDLHATARVWNPTASELVEGLGRRGVPVIHGRFAGSPQVFSGRDDEPIRLLDLEDDNRHLLVLLFADGKGVDPEGARVLEEVAEWPAVAWMDLREPRFWEEGGRRPVRRGIPVFPATEEGVQQAFAHFRSLSRAGEYPNDPAGRARRSPPRLPVHGDIRAQVEEIAGDALTWAQACSMVQPISAGLAGELRQRFFPLLPPERIGRLFALPGTRHTVAGLRFSGAVLTVLRSGFQVFRSSSEQEEVLRFLLDQIDEVRPGIRDGLAALAWEALRERVHLELEPDVALEQLARLATTPLGPTIRGELRDVVLPSDGAIPREGGRPRIPLRCAPRGFEGYQRLARLAPASGIPIRRFRPLRRWEGLIVGLLGLSFLITGGLGIARSVEPLRPEPLLAVGSNQEGTWIRIGDLKGRWGKERRLGTPGTFEKFTEDLSGGFRLAVFRDGALAIRPFEPSKGNSGKSRLLLKVTSRHLPCTTQYDNFGLTLERCPPDVLPSGIPYRRPSWRESLGSPPPGNRLLSVGLEIEGDPAREEELRPLRKALLATGSVDLIYRIDLTRKDPRAAAEEIVRQLDPWTDRAQLVWWWVAPRGGDTADAAAIQAVDTLGRHFATVYRIDRGTDLAWASRVRDLLVSSSSGRISGAQLQVLLGSREQLGPGADIILLQAPAPPPVPEVTLEVNFLAQSIELPENAPEELSRVALQIKQNPDLVAWIKGYADPREKPSEAQLLSEARARAVQRFLVTRHGIALSLITIEGQEAARLRAEQGPDQAERRLTRVLISMHSPDSTAEVGREEFRPATSLGVSRDGSSVLKEPSMFTVPVGIHLHGLIALVPTAGGKMTALFVDARHSPPSAELPCFSPFVPLVRILTSSPKECVEAGCILMGGKLCTCNLARQEISIQPQPEVEPPWQQLTKRPKSSLPSNDTEAGDFSYIGNLAQPPLNMELKPEFLAPMPPNILVARMSFSFESVTACSIVMNETGTGIQEMSFRRSGVHESEEDISQALAQYAVFTLRVPENTPLKLSIRDFDGSNAHLLSLEAGVSGYYIELSNARGTSLMRDDPCADGAARDFAFFYELAEDPPSWADRLIPHAKYKQRGEGPGALEAPGCSGPSFHKITTRPMCPMASFNP